MLLVITSKNMSNLLRWVLAGKLLQEITPPFTLHSNIAMFQSQENGNHQIS